MLMMKERRAAFRTIEGWARLVLLEAGAIRECEEHGWAKDRADPHARDRALIVARQEPPVRRLSGRSGRRRGGRARLDRRCLPGVRARGMSILSEKGPRRLQTARQRRLDRAHVPPAIECFAGEERPRPSELASTDCAFRVSSVAYE